MFDMTWNEETRILRADEGKWVTEDDINFAIEVKLAPSESPDNWWEVDHLPDNDNNEQSNIEDNEL